MAEKTSTGSEHLVIQTAFFGDLLLGTPLFKNLRLIRPQDKITLLCRRGLGDFMMRSGLVDEAIEVDKSEPSSWREAVLRLSQRHFEWLLCPHESPRSTWLARSLSAERKVGYRHLLSVFAFDDRIRRPMELPEALRQLALLEPLQSGWFHRLEEFAAQQGSKGGLAADGGLLEVPEWAAMNLPSLDRVREEYFSSGSLSALSAKAREAAESFDLSRPFAFLAPGSVWPTKMWTRDGFTQVAREMSKAGYQVVLFGSSDEREVCQAIANEAPGAKVVAGLTNLFESAQLLALAKAFVGNDSGAMHLAAMAGVPTVSIFGPTVLEFGYRPWQSRARVLEVPRAELKCRPCGKHGAKLCPIGTHECMKRIQASAVVEAVLTVVAGR